MEVSYQLSEQLSKKVEADISQCYRNAFFVLAWDILPSATYVEGWAITDEGGWLEHGWLEYEGEIVDPTLPVMHCGMSGYYPALRFRGEELGEKLGEAGGQLPLFYLYGFDGGEPMKRAWKAARNDKALKAYLDSQRKDAGT